jgi:phospholipid-binding lipoprotein MlaA
VSVYQPPDVSEKTDAWDDALYDELDEDYDDLNDEYPLMDSEGTGARVADPLEPFNRVMFTINDKLYFWVLKPTASVYGAIFPQQMRTGINNVFHNLAFPIRFISSVLQLKLGKAAKEVGAFAMNTTFGIGGLVKISDHIDPLKDISPEDLGQTLAHYGVGDGFYIVWPVFGPSTLRDTTGTIGEYFLDPINYIDEWEIRWALKGEKTVNYTSLHIGEYEDLKEAAFDPYEALKDFYIQHHRHLTRE